MSGGDSHTGRAGARGWFAFPTAAGVTYSVEAQQRLRDLKSDDESLVSRRHGECDVTSFGAVGNNITSDTAAVAAAISHCRETFHDGAIVRFPAPGKYLIGQTNVTSNMTLFVESGATIVGSPRKQDYPRGVPVCKYTRKLPLLESITSRLLVTDCLRLQTVTILSTSR